MPMRPRTLHLSEDFRESALAFVEKRKPGLQGAVSPSALDIAVAHDIADPKTDPKKDGAAKQPGSSHHTLLFLLIFLFLF